MDKKPTPGEIVIMASGAVALIFSFFDFFKSDFGDGVSAWSSGLFPLATYIAIIGVILAAGVALRVFASVAMPERILGFTSVQLHLILGFFALLIAVGFLIIDKGASDLGVGFWLMLIASIGMVVGAVLEMNEAGRPAGGTPPSAPPAA